MLTPGQTLSLAIEKPAAGGAMIARADGQIVFVAGAIPGERVTARVQRIAKDLAYAETVAVDAASPDRREGLSDPLCGGCLYSHIAYPRQLAIKAQIIADAFARIAHVALPGEVAVAASPEDGYRMRARLHVRGPRLGFFREGTHDVCDVRATRQLLPQTCDVLERLMAVLRSLGVGAVREVELTESVDASDRVVALDAVSAIDARALEHLAATDGLTGLVSPSGGHGRPHVTDRLSIGRDVTIAIRRHVLAFFQGNRHLLPALVTHVIAQLPEGTDVVELYAGVGLFSVGAAAGRAVNVTAVEGDRHAADDLAVNASAVSPLVTAVHDTVEDFVQRTATQTGRAAVLVDPPRTGVSRQALDGILGLHAPRLVYVSCDVATLARDARRIVDAGYTLVRLDGFDLFPNTPHVETVAVFDR